MLLTELTSRARRAREWSEEERRRKRLTASADQDEPCTSMKNGISTKPSESFTTLQTSTLGRHKGKHWTRPRSASGDDTANGIWSRQRYAAAEGNEFNIKKKTG